MATARERDSGEALHVDPRGRDTWSGRRPEPAPDGGDGPFATLERARDEIRRMKAAGGLPAGGIRVEVAGGAYLLERPLDLTAEDGGTAAAPVTFGARRGGVVRLMGGRVLDGFQPVTDPVVLERLAPEARGQVLQLDLRAHGFTEYGEPTSGGMELFHGGEPMSLARWPKEGFARIAGLVGVDPVDVRGTRGDRTGKFLYDGDRPARWAAEKDPWVHGYWFWDWSDQRHRVAAIDPERRVIEVEPPYHGYGYRIGQWYYGYNLLCELSRPGEWYLDRDTGVLYFWPPGPAGGVETAVSATQNLLTATGVEHLTLSGLTFELCRGTAVVLSDCRHLRLDGCAFRNLGGRAVEATGGGDVGVRGCDIWNTGMGGITLTGGDRPRLEPAGHFVEDCHIHHYGRVNRMYQPAVAISGVGIRVAHNLIHDAPHMAVSFSGNDHAIELNEIHHVCLESNDAGAIYSGRDWTWRGTSIRHNLFYEITGFENRGCVGVYLDDMLCGTEIRGNLFYRVTRAAFIGGGRDCTVENNLFVDCQPALHVDDRAMTWAGYHVGTTMKERLEAMPYREPHWVARYPELLTLWEDEPAAPKGNVVRHNVCQGGRWDEVNDNTRPYVCFEDNLVAEDVGLSGTPPASFALAPDSPARVIEFEAIPMDQIGPRRPVPFGSRRPG
ncbi:MAG: right-handed parallel beta-helix repeat-containing protein [Gemmatimonadota bacterium]